MRKLLLSAVSTTFLSATVHAQCANPKALHCVCTQSADPRVALGYGPADASRQSVSAPWTCIDNDTMAVTYHDGRAYVTADPSNGVKLQSPGGSSYSSDFHPPQ